MSESIIAAMAVMSPVLMVLVQWLVSRSMKKQQWERDDHVADAAATVARKLIESNSKVNGKLDQIHTLVNSNMTQAMQSELDAMVRELAMMYEVIELKNAAGHEATTESLVAIKVTAAKIEELKSALGDRLRQTIAADAELRDALVTNTP